MPHLKFTLLVAFSIIYITVIAQVKIGDNPSSIGSSSLLELESTDKGLVIPRVANPASIITPVNGMFIYDISATCMKFYRSGNWSSCLTEADNVPKIGSLSSLDCAGATSSPSIILSGAVYSGSLSIDYTGADGGFYNGNAVSSTGVTGLTARIAAGGFTVGDGSITYTVSGTPSVAGTASFAISIGGQSCTVNLTVNTGDAIRAELSGSSLTNYDAAADGDWVTITKAEYDALASNITNLTRSGTPEANVLTGPLATFSTSTLTYGHSNNPSPANSYIFAFKVALTNGEAIASAGNSKVKLSSSNGGTGFNQFGSTLPDGTIDGDQQHFVIKNTNTLHTSPMYLGLTLARNSPYGELYYEATGTTGRYATGDVSTVSSALFGWSMQLLTTTVKQW